MEIDVSPLTKMCGKIIPDTDIEIELVKLYRKKVFTTNMVDTFTNIVLQRIYGDNLIRPYGAITKFYTEKDYLTKVYKFLDLNTVLLNRAIGPEHVDIVFNSIVEYVKYEKLICTYDVYWSGDEKD